jgi:hypothetical protein
VPDVFVYDNLSQALRVQLFHSIQDGIGEWYLPHGVSNTNAQLSYKTVVSALRREYGVFDLRELQEIRGRQAGSYLDELRHHLLNAQTEQVLDAVELCARLMENTSRQTLTASGRNAEAAIREMNARFREHAVGYEFSNGEIFRIDSEFVHAETVKPALALLRGQAFAGVEDEFLSAFDHYRKGDTKEALTDALKALESTLKVICNKRGWAVQPSDTAKKLIDVCFAQDLIPSYWQTHFSSLRAMLESSIPTARNKASGHGQGGEIRTVPDHLAAYVLHMTASTIVFLTKAEEALS